ncbi:MAG: hypothetical protein GY780_16575 [bacterium]|nr:hypothetical protein [bacterium]
MSAFGSCSRLNFALLVLFSLFAGTVAQGAAPSGQVIFESGFSADLVNWNEITTGVQYPEIEGLHSLSEPGQPLLPVQNLVLLIPAGRTVTSAWIEPLNTRSEKSSRSLALASAHVTDGGELVYTRRMEAFEGVFPASWGEFGGTHTWRGYNLLTMNVYPIRASVGTADGALEYLEDFAVRVLYDDGSDQIMALERERLVPGEKESNEEVLRQIIHNKSALSGYSRIHGVTVAEDKGPFNPTRTPSLSGSPVQYLIITNAEMEAEFQRLADYKTSLGMNTIVATREFISSNYRNGADIQETIRMFIKDAYAKWGVEYVMLGGDTDVLPARYVDNTFYPVSGSTEIPVDMYFACLDGNWNANGNAHYGEAEAEVEGAGDLVDFAEEVYLGRATVSNATAARSYVDKIIAYETAPPHSEWTNNILFAAEVLFWVNNEEDGDIVLDGAKFVDEMINDLIIPCTDMNYTRMYETDELYPRDAELTREALIDSLNTGHYGIFNQIGHGFYFNMSVGDANFMNSDADGLTNGDNLFLLFSLNCASAAFDFSCLMERFIQNPNGGSIASVGSSRAAFPNTANNYQQEFFHALYCTSENRLGKLIAISRLPFLGSTDYNYVDRWTFENYSLLGDPTIPLWTGSPESLQVSTGNLNLGPNQVAVSVLDDQGTPVSNANVCLSHDGGDIASGFTDASGAVSLDFLASVPDDVAIHVTGEDLGQYSSTIEVLDGDTYFTLNNLVVLDDGSGGTTGNNNNDAESGETVGLLPFLLETAGAGATGLSGVLSSSTPNVSVLTGSVNFTDAAAAGQSIATSPFLVSFGNDLTDGTPVDFSLLITDANSDTYEVQWTEVLKAPEVEVVKIDWEDGTFGNGDGLIGDSERVVMSIQLKNFGAGRADLVNMTLRTFNPNVTLFDTLGSVVGLDLMETSPEVVSFSLSLIDSSRKSESYLVLTDNYGRTFEHSFYIQRPMAPDNILTDTSLGADVIALSWDPVDDENIFGYNIFRSENETGPFERVNVDVVAGTSYFRDEGLGQLTKYYYQVNSMGESLVPSTDSVIVEQATAPAELAGFPVEFVIETSGHLAVGDVDGDGDSEIVLASDEVYVWHHDGTELLDGDNESQSLGPITDWNTILQPAGVVLADLDDEPGKEMILMDRGLALIQILRKDGTNLPGWPQSTNYGNGTKWAWATPAVGDIDGDGADEIVVNTLNGFTYAWHADGTEVIDGDDDPSTNGVLKIRAGATWEWSASSPALYDLDGDGAKDIIFGANSDSEGGHRLMALKHDGTDVSGFPYSTPTRVNNSPAVGDLNNDGIMEIVFYDYSKNLHAVQQNGVAYSGFPVNFNYGAMTGAGPSVALGDMDQDGELEIIFAGNINGNTSKIAVVDTDINGGTSGQLMSGWPIELPGSTEGSPVVGDIDGDTVPDILYGIGGGSEDAPNNLYAFKANGNAIDGFPITLTGPLMPSPVICDVDNDRDVDIVYGGWDRAVHVWDMPFAYDRNNVPWPTFHGNMKRDGVFGALHLVGVDNDGELPAAAFQVDAPYPNPFNPSTSIRLHVPVIDGSSNLELVVYDLQGRKVRTLHNGPISSGWHTLVWDGRDNGGRTQSSGMYFMRARSGAVASIHKMTLVK